MNLSIASKACIYLLAITSVAIFSGAAQAQVPSQLLISKSSGTAPVTGNLLMTPTTRPAGKTTQRITFRMKGDDYFYEGTWRNTYKANPNHLWVVLRGSTSGGTYFGRGIIIGNVHLLASANPSSGACPHSGTSQASLWTQSQKLFASSCLNKQYRLTDGHWYKVTVDVNDSKYVKYWISEVNEYGTTLRTFVNGVSTLTTAPVGQTDPSINSTGVAIATLDAGNQSFMLDIRDLSVTWY